MVPLLNFGSACVYVRSYIRQIGHMRYERVRGPKWIERVRGISGLFPKLGERMIDGYTVVCLARLQRF